MKSLSIVILSTFLSMYAHTRAQDGYLQSDRNPVELSQEDWEEIISERNYEEKAEPVDEVENNNELPAFDWSAFGWVKYVLITMLVALVVFLLVKIISAKDNNRVGDAEISYERLEELEGNLEEADLQKFLKNALASGDYKLALRVLYLISLKEMEQKNWIIYRKDKTNLNYVMEMTSRPEVSQFARLTQAFELVWYGDLDFDKKEYELIQPPFMAYIDSVKDNEQR